MQVENSRKEKMLEEKMKNEFHLKNKVNEMKESLASNEIMANEIMAKRLKGKENNIKDLKRKQAIEIEKLKKKVKDAESDSKYKDALISGLETKLTEYRRNIAVEKEKVKKQLENKMSVSDILWTVIKWIFIRIYNVYIYNAGKIEDVLHAGFHQFLVTKRSKNCLKGDITVPSYQLWYARINRDMDSSIIYDLEECTFFKFDFPKDAKGFGVLSWEKESHFTYVTLFYEGKVVIDRYHFRWTKECRGPLCLFHHQSKNRKFLDTNLFGGTVVDLNESKSAVFCVPKIA